MKKDIRFLIARNRELYGRAEADWDTEDYARFANDFLRNRGYENVNVEYVENYPEGDADDQAALREEIMDAYRARKGGKDPTQKYAR